MKQIDLFDDNIYNDEWQDMPEFKMTPEVPILTIKVSFKTKEDIEEFSKLINQNVQFNKENYWYPKLNRKAFSDYYYKDEEL
jgi:hypothetical protein